MTVGELKKFLENFPDDMEFITTRYSDYAIVEEGDFGVVKGVPKCGWVMRSHPTMSQENKDAERKYLHLRGN